MFKSDLILSQFTSLNYHSSLLLPLSLIPRVSYFYCLVSLMLTYYAIIHKGDDATSIPAECCAYPYIVNGALYYNCSVNAALSSDFGCYNNNGQWVTCLQPESRLRFRFMIAKTFKTKHPTKTVRQRWKITQQFVTFLQKTN